MYYLQYFLKAGNAHSIHPPYLYELYRKVIRPAKKLVIPEVETLLKKYGKNSQKIPNKDLGSGSYHKNYRKIKDIAQLSTSHKKIRSLLGKLSTYHDCRRTLELGTSLGIGTYYLASANPKSEVVTIEGNQALSAIAAEGARELGINNIRFLQGDIDKQAPELTNAGPYDLIYIDANHSYQATKRYVFMLLPHLSENGIIVVGDIHWSQEMHRIWFEFTQSSDFTLTVDLFYVGLLFKNSRLSKQHFILHF